MLNIFNEKLTYTLCFTIECFRRTTNLLKTVKNQQNVLQIKFARAACSKSVFCLSAYVNGGISFIFLQIENVNFHTQ